MVKPKARAAERKAGAGRLRRPAAWRLARRPASRRRCGAYRAPTGPQDAAEQERHAPAPVRIVAEVSEDGHDRGDAPSRAAEPPTTLICWKLPKKPRRSCGAHSTMKAVEPPHSPPAEKPCTARRTTSRIGASDADALVGRQQADQHRAERHQEDGEQQRGLAALGVAEAADHDAAERPRHEADAKAAKAASSEAVGSVLGKEFCAIMAAR